MKGEVVVLTSKSDKARLEAVRRFCEAQQRLIESTEVMVDTAYAVTWDPTSATALNELLRQIAEKQAELAELTGSLTPLDPTKTAA